MKKFSILLAVTLLAAVLLTGCSSKYRETDFVGKTSLEIQAEYGDFDCVTMPAGDDGLYRNCRCGYTLREPKTGFLGTSPELLYFIRFDENGIAVSCEEGYRPGG